VKSTACVFDVQGHRTLVFSQSRVMLDILQSAIRAAGWRFLRLDGSVASASDRAVCSPCRRSKHSWVYIQVSGSSPS